MRDRTARAASTDHLPLTSRRPDDILFRRAGGVAVSCGQFLRDVAAVAAGLPDRPYALNLCTDRYHFLVAFAAVLTRRQVSLLSTDRTPHGLEQLVAVYPQAYSIGDEAAPLADLDHVPLQLAGGSREPDGVPMIPARRAAAIVATSGSTGKPALHAKPWGALVACSEAAAERFGFGRGGTASIVGTVPPQHMYGFETTVLLPLHADVSSYAGSTFFPYDIAQALATVPEPRVLVTTPVQLTALVAAGQPLPPLEMVISATSPLDADLAARVEAGWRTRVLEIFGATEVGSIASRRTVDGRPWETYRSVRLRPEGEAGIAVSVAQLPGEVMLADRVELLDAGSFRLLGRRTDLIKRAGKRASLTGLNAILQGIEGVEDGIFFAPDDLETNAKARLSAFVVAPTRSPEEIIAALRTRIEAPFLPRRVVKVEALPRNDVGKIMRSALVELSGAGGRGQRRS
ncbi:MAG TPA: AMP-binding protein [Geminicoccaceae bacterium]|nr:AMP-binding protein [Geminicoccus sp.]HMU51235.1 AMP-binding protein [Geminicoccaceae bacterium]